YAVTVASPPSGLACIVRAGSGTVGTGDVSSVRIICGYAVAGSFDTATVSGVFGQLFGVVLTLAGATALAPYFDAESIMPPVGAATFTFADLVPRGGTCALSVAAQPRAFAELCSV